MKKTLAKMLICFLIFLILFNFTLASDAYIAPIEGSMGSTDDASTVQSLFNKAYDLLINSLGAFVGLATWQTRVGVFALVAAVQVLISGIVSIGGFTDDGLVVTPFTIFFNRVPLLNVNFMNFNVSDNTIKTFRTQVATWYYVLRVIATAILLLILIYIGIRMAISTVASDKAIYKKMLVDWLCSLALLYLLHYFIIFILNLNDIFVQILSDIGDYGGGISGNLKTFSKYIGTIAVQAVSKASGFNGIVSLILYAIIIGQTLKYLVLYLKRMITVGFLIIISPLITITYSIDKIGDQKAQALNTWMKEFCYNVLIQPFHCIMYMTFVDVSLSLIQPSMLNTMFDLLSFVPGLATISAFANAGVNTLQNSNTLAGGILAVVCIKFVDDGEKIIRKIFGFEKASSLDSAVNAMATLNTLKDKAKDFGKTALKAKALGGKIFNLGTSAIGKDVGLLKNNLNKFSNSRVGQAVGGAARNAGKAVKSAGNAVATSKIGTAAGKVVKKAGSAVYTRAAKSATSAKNFMANKGKNRYFSRAKNGAKKAISGAVGNISNYLHDSDYMSTIIGITAGLTMYGATSNGALTSILVGMGAKNSAYALLSNTSNQIGNDITASVQNTENYTGEFKSKSEVSNYLNAVKFVGDSGGYDSKSFNDEANKLLNALQNFMSEQRAQAVANTMLAEGANNPNFDADKYLQDVFKNCQQEETDPDKLANLANDSLKASATDSAKECLKFTSDARTYNGIQIAESAGMSIDQISEIVSGNMNLPDTTPQQQTVKVVNKETNEEITITSTQELGDSLDKIKNEIENSTKDTIKNLEDTFNDIVNNTSGYANDSTNQQVLDIRTIIDDKKANFQQE